MSEPKDSTQRFSHTVDNYIKFRPDYPKGIIPWLKAEFRLSPYSVVADIGSGTGILTWHFLNNGNTVFAVEPNLEMRSAAEKLHGQYHSLKSIDGTAEATTLQDNAVNFVVAAQAFHWFDKVKTRQEFERILKPNGKAILIWNERNTSTPFLQEYDQMLIDLAPDYSRVDHRQITDEVVNEFFAPNEVHFKSFDNVQVFDYAGLEGRLLSSSYALTPEDQDYPKMIASLKDMFDRHQQNGTVDFIYDTKVYVSSFNS
jgi:SAM-dependent methyltransferase